MRLDGSRDAKLYKILLTQPVTARSSGLNLISFMSYRLALIKDRA
jgi:hypothetical protein